MSHKPWGLSTKIISHKDSAGQCEQDTASRCACTQAHTHTVWPVWLVIQLISLNISSTFGAARGRLALSASRMKRLLWGEEEEEEEQEQEVEETQGVILNITYMYGTVFTHFQFNQYLPQTSQTISGTFPNQSPRPPGKKITRLRRTLVKKTAATSPASSQRTRLSGFTSLYRNQWPGQDEYQFPTCRVPAMGFPKGSDRSTRAQFRK